MLLWKFEVGDDPVEHATAIHQGGRMGNGTRQVHGEGIILLVTREINYCELHISKLHSLLNRPRTMKSMSSQHLAHVEAFVP